MKKRLRKFTLIEMIAVIAIIAILMAILLPVVTKMTRRAKETKAKAEMQAIALAIKSYESTYGILPFGGAETVMDSSDYDTMMGVLTNVGGGNTRQIRFLDVPDDYTSKGYVDPWDNDYKIFIDTDYDGDISVLGDSLYGTVFIYSTGKGGGADDYIYSWK
jgi:prepilin-type N-terminal cleavage/methylation domain-containing protein